MKLLLVFGIAFIAFPISHSATPEFCNLPHDEGEGMTFSFALYYDPIQDSCQPFLYKGEKGNENRFANERECIRNCSANAEQIYPMDASLACHFRKENGKCSGNFLRYYYDSVHDKCKKFLWSGCIGNGNRFTDQEICNATCAGIHDDGDEAEEDEPDTPVALICGIVLGLIGAIIVIAIVVLSVQSKDTSKKAPRPAKETKTELPLQDKATDLP